MFISLAGVEVKAGVLEVIDAAGQACDVELVDGDAGGDKLVPL